MSNEGSKLDVIFYETFEEELKALKVLCPKSVRAEYYSGTIQESGHQSPPAKLISIRTQSAIPQGWIPHISAILSRSTGYDHLLEYRNAVQCGYLPDYASTAVAEHAMILWSMLLRKFPQQISQFDTFKRDGITGRQNLGKNLFIAGVGRIGTKIADFGEKLNMNVGVYDPALSKLTPQLNMRDAFDRLSDGIEWADIIVCSASLTDSSRSMFNYETLSRAKPDAIFVNVSRAECSPIADLLKLIREEKLGGIGLDVFENEKVLGPALRDGNHPKARSDEVENVRSLASQPNVICTPHNAFNTVQAVEGKARDSITQTVSFLNERKFRWIV